MRFFRHTGIFRSYYLFTVAVLAVVATRDLAAAIRHQPDRTAWKPFSAASAYVASCAVVAFIAVANSVPNTGINVLTIFLSKVHAAGVWVGICGVALTGWMLPSRFRQWSVPALLVALAAVDAFLTHKVSTELIFDTRPKSVARWNDLDAQHSAALDLTGSGLQRERRSCLDTNQPCTTLSTDQMITKAAVFNSYTSHKNPFHLRMLNQPVLRNSATGADRIWFAKDVVQVDASKGSFEAFLKRAQALGAPPLVVHDRGELLSSTNSNNESPAQQVAQIETLPAAEKIAVNLERYSPDELAFSVECPSDGWLLVTDRWARSWQAKVNGKQTAVYGGNFIFRAIQVSAGQNQVRFTYDVLGFPWLLIISWGTLAVVAISSAYFHWRGYKSVENIR
jgi:hypothetical protein